MSGAHETPPAISGEDDTPWMVPCADETPLPAISDTHHKTKRYTAMGEATITETTAE